MYTYVKNNPLKYVDPSGHAQQAIDNSGGGNYVDVSGYTHPNSMSNLLKTINYAKRVKKGDNDYWDLRSSSGTKFRNGRMIPGDSDNNQFIYLFEMATMTSPYENSEGNSQWATIQLLNYYDAALSGYGIDFLAALSGGGAKGISNVMSSSQAAKKIINAERTGTALNKSDPGHRAASFLSQSQLSKGSTFNITGGDGVQRTLLQVRGELDRKSGIYEYILQLNGTVSHQRFIEGGIINGIPNQKSNRF
ncbi:hypothetical protein [Paenibacillus lutrae]|uniref:Uncharacterized protein n=1 Tax=Paenibacillus lutrae TaxID=2078573 RepID=A0A7X3FP20_9BACL|nr:hypothetical protein [Paenibacillus lutrae]MVP02567.1 hypothetical protein [Paenibacillus lutrae]